MLRCGELDGTGVAVTVGMLVGGTMGILAGYLRGKVDAVLSIFFDTFLAIPAIILALALVAAFDPADPNLVSRRIESPGP